MRLADKINISPLLRIFVPLAAGIVASQWIGAPQWIVSIVALCIYAAAWLLRKTDAGWWYVTAAVFMTGILLARLNTLREEMPRGERVLMVAEIGETPYTHGRWQRTTAQVGYFRPYDFARKIAGDHTIHSETPNKHPNTQEGLNGRDGLNGRNGADGTAEEWTQCSEKIQLYVDTCYRIAAGEQLTFRGYLNPIDTTGSSYGRLMRSRGMSARSYVVPNALIARMMPQTHPPSYWAAQVQHAAVERIMRLDLNEADRNMVATLVAGERRGIDPKLREAYSITGVAHILSVSGLHMGFVLILVNLLLGWVVFFKRGHLIKNGLVIAAMWCYAVVAGLSAPVVRSALMLSFAQLALGTSQRGNGYNIVLGAATLMLGINPNYLYDVSFQLSFVAVLSILFFYPRLYRYRKHFGKTPDTLVSTLMLGIAAQIGTLPLVAYSFGNVPLIALLVNPVVILTSFVVISAGLLWLLLPLGILNPLCSFVIKNALWIQNGSVSWAAETPIAAVRGVHIGGTAVLLMYGAMGFFALWIKLHEEAKTEKPSFRHAT